MHSNNMDYVSNRHKSKTQGLVCMQRNVWPKMRALHHTPESIARAIKSHRNMEPTRDSMSYVDPTQSVSMLVRPTPVWHGSQTMHTVLHSRTTRSLHRVDQRALHYFGRPEQYRLVVKYMSAMVVSTGRDMSLEPDLNRICKSRLCSLVECWAHQI